MIRHHLAYAALSLALLCGAPAFAQTPALSPSHLQVAREIVDLTGVSQNIDGIYAEFADNTKQMVGTTRPEMVKDVNEVLLALKPEADKRSEEVTKTAVEIFARKMTEADLKEVLAFFKSPVGQRYSALRPQAMEEIYKVLQPWSVQTSNYLFDRFSQEMRKRGHQL
ncbi:DUF2059 domain-containing protein [Bosea lathyri]|jgi:hypothetical protein|uniref:DUF2059 domain-containing protein n=1 Tax=Bosea lathyri TaxID=1036778 RepID=A0A1H6BWW9_9HYPH|nr:DUF2059 domain-containing protein [Bosea lathyri]SEG65153.1 hypothetical protein SAMN04488115_108155 [Bosea lathyri]